MVRIASIALFICENTTRNTPSSRIIRNNTLVRPSRPLLSATLSDTMPPRARQITPANQRSPQPYRFFQAKIEVFYVVHCHDVMNEDFDTETGSIGTKQDPDAVVLRCMHQNRHAAFLSLPTLTPWARNSLKLPCGQS